MKKLINLVMLTMCATLWAGQDIQNAETQGRPMPPKVSAEPKTPAEAKPAIKETGDIPLYVLLNDIDPQKNRKPQVTSKPGQVSIYADHDNGLYGRSLYRTMILTVKDKLFKRTECFYVNKEVGSYLTGVVVSSQTVQALQKVLKNCKSICLGEYEIEIDTCVQSPLPDTTVYRFRSHKHQLETSFSVERAPQELIKTIEMFYHDDPKNRALVVDHYKSNYIIRIFSAENCLDPWNHDINMNEALIMATYLGDLEQPLWGIADGSAHLARALVKAANCCLCTQ